MSLIFALTFAVLPLGYAHAAPVPERQAALDLMHLILPREAYALMIQQMSEQMIDNMRQGGAQIPPDVASKMKLIIEEILPYQDMMDWNAEIYSRRFSVSEIRALVAFYKTPVGQKLARALPDISGEAGKKIGMVMMERLPLIMKKHGMSK